MLLKQLSGARLFGHECSQVVPTFCTANLARVSFFLFLNVLYCSCCCVIAEVLPVSVSEIKEVLFTNVYFLRLRYALLRVVHTLTANAFFTCLPCKVRDFSSAATLRLSCITSFTKTARASVIHSKAPGLRFKLTLLFLESPVSTLPVIVLAISTNFNFRTCRLVKQNHELETATFKRNYHSVSQLPNV